MERDLFAIRIDDIGGRVTQGVGKTCAVPGSRAATFRRENAARVLPKSKRYRDGIDADLGPPCCLVACTMKLAVVDAAQRHRELIRYLAAECAWLREP